MYRMKALILTAASALVFTFGLVPGTTSIDQGSTDLAHAAQSMKQAATEPKPPSPAVSTAIRYVKAMAGGDRVAVGRLDFACQFRIVSTGQATLKASSKHSDALHTQCWEPIEQANVEPVDTRDRGMHALWPGRGKLVFFGQDLRRYHYAPSSFVSEFLGKSPPGSGLTVKHVGTKQLPGASFRLHPGGKMVGVPATLVLLRVTYKDPLGAPATYAPGAYTWANTVKRPRRALKAVTLKWVVLSELKRLGFPRNFAVVNLPVVAATATHPAVPFLTEYSGYVKGSAEWWGPADTPDTLVTAIERAAQLPKLRDRVGMLNRVLIIDPEQADALTALTRDLFQAILENGADAHKMELKDTALAARFTEFYWDTYAQTERMDISLAMEMGGLSKPTPADYLFRMIPAMETLAEIRPQDLENRIRLGIGYRWNLDQLTAIETHAALVENLPSERPALRARALTELAWSRITKVAFNRTFDDPGIRKAYEEAQEALTLSESPIDKFAAAYTMAYSLVFIPDRDNRDILELLTKAKRWYLQVAGASEVSWRVLLENETLKAVIDADPALQPLVALQD